MIRLIRDERGSAYAWLTFSVFMWVFCTIWYFFINPMFISAIQTAENSNYTILPGASEFYAFYKALFPILPFLMIFFAVVGFLKYASSAKRRWDEY